MKFNLLYYRIRVRNQQSNVIFKFDRVLQVSREGKCTQSDVPRQLIYGTMVYVRQTIVADASVALSRAVTIATRYSCVRRQFGSQNGGPETQVFYVPFHDECSVFFSSDVQQVLFWL